MFLVRRNVVADSSRTMKVAIVAARTSLKSLEWWTKVRNSINDCCEQLGETGRSRYDGRRVRALLDPPTRVRQVNLGELS